MPGFFTGVQGLKALFQIPTGAIDIANRNSPRFVENMLPGPKGETRNSGPVMDTRGIGDHYLRLPIVRSVLPFFTVHEWISFDSASRVERRCCHI